MSRAQERRAEERRAEAANITPSEKDTPEEPKEKPINDTHPLWTKHPNDCSDEEYREFYRKVFLDFKSDPEKN